MSQNTKPFQENISIICGELHLAKKWGKASILLTLHRSTRSQEKTKKALQKKLGELGYGFVEIEINKIEGNFIEYILQHENVGNAVFCISHIDWGGGDDERDGYRTLNLYRETFVEHNIKVIFFLTLHEASKLPNFAPDFWAFRHRVLEFRNPRAYNQKQPPAGLMLWHMGNSITPIIDIKRKVPDLKKTLADMPDQAENVSMRIDLQYELGFLYWKSGDSHNAENTFTSGIRLAETYKLFDLLEKLQNGLAIIRYEQGSYQSAMDLLDPLINDNPHDCLLILNQAIVLFAMKKRYNAILKGKKSVSLCTQNPWAWNSLGFLHYFAGNMDEAVTSFQKAIEISPKSGYFYESLAVCYLAIGLEDKANVQLHQAKKNSDDREIFQDILKDYIEGNTEKASLLIKEAKNSSKLKELEIIRDPILSAVAVSI